MTRIVKELVNETQQYGGRGDGQTPKATFASMQLKFFEKFDPGKCKKKCDNCNAGRKPDRRDFSNVASSMLRLLNSMTAQRRNGKVTQFHSMLISST